MLSKPGRLAGWAAATLAIAPPAAIAYDEIGIFFDATAAENCIIAEQNTTMDAYLLILDPSAGGGVAGWECSVEIENVMMLGVTLSGQAIDAAAGNLDFQVGLMSPLPAGPVVELARLSLLVHTTDPAGFYIYPPPIPSLGDTPAYADGSDPSNLLPLRPHVIGADDLVAGINRPGCIPEDSTWGRLKSIFE